MDLNISKAKLTKKGCLEVVYADKEGNDIVFKGINPVHPDLKDSLNKLIPYIVDITEQKESQYINWERPESCLEDEFFKKFNVTGNFLCHVRHLLNILWYGAAFSPAPAAGHCFHCSTDRSTERLCDRVLKRLI